MNILNKINEFAALVEKEQIERLYAEGLDCVPNIAAARTQVKVGPKYTRVDVGNSGRFMVENKTGNIFGIKGYGVVHRGHFYGNLDTITEYNWGGYYPRKKVNPTATTTHNIPKLTFAPQPAKKHKT